MHNTACTLTTSVVCAYIYFSGLGDGGGSSSEDAKVSRALAATSPTLHNQSLSALCIVVCTSTVLYRGKVDRVSLKELMNRTVSQGDA